MFVALVALEAARTDLAEISERIFGNVKIGLKYVQDPLYHCLEGYDAISEVLANEINNAYMNFVKSRAVHRVELLSDEVGRMMLSCTSEVKIKDAEYKHRGICDSFMKFKGHSTGSLFIFLIQGTEVVMNRLPLLYVDPKTGL